MKQLAFVQIDSEMNWSRYTQYSPAKSKNPVIDGVFFWLGR
jgi:hypothetical protein